MLYPTNMITNAIHANEVSLTKYIINDTSDHIVPIDANAHPNIKINKLFIVYVCF